MRRYLRAAAAAGVGADGGAVTDDDVREVLLALQPAGGRPRGDGWAACVQQREAIRRWLANGLRLTKIRKLLVRQGVAITYPTLYRFAVLELQFGQTTTTIPVLDGEPGQEYGESRVMGSFGGDRDLGARDSPQEVVADFASARLTATPRA